MDLSWFYKAVSSSGISKACIQVLRWRLVRDSLWLACLEMNCLSPFTSHRPLFIEVYSSRERVGHWDTFDAPRAEMDSIKATEIMYRFGSQELDVCSSLNMHLINSSKEARWGRRRVKTFFFPFWNFWKDAEWKRGDRIRLMGVSPGNPISQLQFVDVLKI